MHSQLRPGRQDEFITEACEKDAVSGWATAPMYWDELLLRLQARLFTVTRRFAITQSGGKQRIIDDASAGGQSATSRDSNKLQLCSAIQPAVHLAALQAEMLESSVSIPQWGEIHTGTRTS